MKKLLYYLPFHFLVFLIFGIYLQFYFSIWPYGYKILLLLLVFFGIGFLFIKSAITNTILSFLCFFLLGIALVEINDDRQNKNYYRKYNKKNSIKTLRITKVLKPSLYQFKYEADVIQIDTMPTLGKVLLNISKSEDSLVYNVDDVLLISASFQDLPKALNPYQFDYAAYLKKKGIYQQISSSFNEIIKTGTIPNSFIGTAAKFRSNVQQRLKTNGFKDDVFGVMNALLLGQRDEISRDLLTNYSNAGAIHILAVSGLHVGILLLLLTKLLSPLDYIKNGKYIKSFFIILILWAFAFIAGLSASVIRAVSMFTFVAVGMVLQRKNAIEYALITSAFVLLLCKPTFLFDVGFQMSYLAVFGIVWFQPIFSKIWIPKTPLLLKIWQLLSVSCAAQLGVLPLSLYYFNQFPSLFFLSNLVIVPFLGILLFVGILLIILSMFNGIPTLITQAYHYIVEAMNTFISWVAYQETFLIKEISFSAYQMLFTYLLLLFILLVYQKYSYRRLVSLGVLVVVFQILSIYEHQMQLKKNVFIVFHQNKNTLFAYQNNRQLTANNISHGLKTIQDYKIGERIELVDSQPFPNVLELKNQYLLIVDSLGVYNVQGLNSPKVLLTQSPKINVERLIKTLQPNEIIADGSNYKSYIDHSRDICNKNGVPFYSTKESGAYLYHFKE